MFKYKASTSIGSLKDVPKDEIRDCYINHWAASWWFHQPP